MPVVEFATFKPSTALLADPDLDLEAFNIIQKSEGFLGSWIGNDVEDRKTAYIVVTWDTLDGHKKLPSSPLYPTLAEKLRPILGGPMTIINIEFDKDHTVAVNAPVTEILVHKLKEGKTNEDFNNAVAKLRAHFLTVEGIRHPQAHGPVLESPGTFYSVIGWDSHEVHQTAAARETFEAQMAKLLAIAEVQSVKVEFRKRICSTAENGGHGLGQNTFLGRSSDCSHL